MSLNGRKRLWQNVHHPFRSVKFHVCEPLLFCPFCKSFGAGSTFAELSLMPQNSCLNVEVRHTFMLRDRVGILCWCALWNECKRDMCKNKRHPIEKCLDSVWTNRRLDSGHGRPTLTKRCHTRGTEAPTLNANSTHQTRHLCPQEQKGAGSCRRRTRWSRIGSNPA